MNTEKLAVLCLLAVIMVLGAGFAYEYDQSASYQAANAKLSSQNAILSSEILQLDSKIQTLDLNISRLQGNVTALTSERNRLTTQTMQLAGLLNLRNVSTIMRSLNVSMPAAEGNCTTGCSPGSVQAVNFTAPYMGLLTLEVRGPATTMIVGFMEQTALGCAASYTFCQFSPGGFEWGGPSPVNMTVLYPVAPGNITVEVSDTTSNPTWVTLTVIYTD